MLVLPESEKQQQQQQAVCVRRERLITKIRLIYRLASQSPQRASARAALTLVCGLVQVRPLTVQLPLRRPALLL